MSPNVGERPMDGLAVKPARKPRDFGEWMFYGVIWGLVAPAVLFTIVRGILLIVVGTYSGATQFSHVTEGVLATISFAGYYWSMFKLVWSRWWGKALAGAKVKAQIGQQNAANGALAAQVKGRNNVVNNYLISESDAGGATRRPDEARIRITEITGIRWETPVYHPTLAFMLEAVNEGNRDSALHDAEVELADSKHKFRGRVVRGASPHLGGSTILRSGDRATFEIHVPIDRQGIARGTKANARVTPVLGKPSAAVVFDWP